MILKTASLFFLIASAALAQETVAVVVQQLDRKLRLPAEILPYQAVDLHARVPGFVERVEVDRGSVVKKGQLLLELVAPEMKAQLAEVEAKAQAIESQRAEAEAKLAGVEALLERLRQAATTAGAVAGIEVIQAQKSADALKSQITSIQSQAKATRASAAAITELIGYLKVTAPFDGVIFEKAVEVGDVVNGMVLRTIFKIQSKSERKLVLEFDQKYWKSVIQRFLTPIRSVIYIVYFSDGGSCNTW